jgi:signal transduction histidine kinase
LLVDDLDENLLALEGLLRRDGLTLLRANSGEQALEHLLAHDVALALVDVQMPSMDGFELAELMRGTERTRRVPIIFLTAGSNDWSRRFRGYEMGAVDYLQKPVEPDILKSKADVFFELYRQRQEVARQRDELRCVLEENARLLDESRRYAEALQEADRRKDEFLATLAHELRNPLAPILNAVQILQMLDDPTVDATQNREARELRDMVERQVTHMVRLVDDLLDVSRITRGKVNLHQERLLISQLLQNAVDTSRPLIVSAKHQLTVSLPPDPLYVDGDVVRLTQVFANLLNNAAKYTPEGGQISVSAEQTGDHVCIRVRDSGVGIPQEMLGRVFEMFAQVNQHLKRSQGGLGIGLTLVKRLVEVHGGTIRVHSEGEGRGAEFFVHLPLADTDPAAITGAYGALPVETATDNA